MRARPRFDRIRCNPIRRGRSMRTEACPGSLRRVDVRAMLRRQRSVRRQPPRHASECVWLASPCAAQQMLRAVAREPSWIHAPSWRSSAARTSTRASRSSASSASSSPSSCSAAMPARRRASRSTASRSAATRCRGASRRSATSARSGLSRSRSQGCAQTWCTLSTRSPASSRASQRVAPECRSRRRRSRGSARSTRAMTRRRACCARSTNGCNASHVARPTARCSRTTTTSAGCSMRESLSAARPRWCSAPASTRARSIPRRCHPTSANARARNSASRPTRSS